MLELSPGHAAARLNKAKVHVALKQMKVGGRAARHFVGGKWQVVGRIFFFFLLLRRLAATAGAATGARSQPGAAEGHYLW